jgi:hypothetical protein
MGKASSSKKVARAARAGGNVRTSRDRKWGFPAAIAGIVVAGSLLVFLVRADEVSQASEPPRLAKDHWHAAYAVYLCDTFGAPLTDTLGDEYGIHTHEDGLIHIHPSTGQAAGANAKLGRFAEEVGLQFGDDSFTLPTGETYTTGDDCNGEEAVVRVIKWPSGDFEGEPEVITSDFGDIRFTGDGEAYTIFFGPESALDDPTALLPPSLAGINQVSDLAPGEEAPNVSIPEDLLAPPTTLAPEGTGTTVTGEPSATATTVAPGATTAPETTPTTAAG